MRRLGKILMSSLVIGGAILGLHNSAIAMSRGGSSVGGSSVGGSSVGRNTGKQYSRGENACEYAMRIRKLCDEYLNGFNFANSNAALLFPNDDIKYIELANTVNAVAEDAQITLPRFITRNKACLYKFIEENYSLFQKYKSYQSAEIQAEAYYNLSLSHQDRMALAVAISEHKGIKIPKAAYKEELVLDKFLVENESYKYLTDQMAG